MSIQDDIFDVDSALEGKPEAEQFENIITYLGNLERKIEILYSFYNAAHDLKNCIGRLKELE